MKTAISLPDDLFAIAEGFAAERGLNRSQLYAMALREYIEAHRHEDLVERINVVCDRVDTSLPADLKRVARATLKAIEW
jgi:metal-responsive CopG/Arc/MetJ family transcriptional regulator